MLREMCADASVIDRSSGQAGHRLDCGMSMSASLYRHLLIVLLRRLMRTILRRARVRKMERERYGSCYYLRNAGTDRAAASSEEETDGEMESSEDLLSFRQRRPPTVPAHTSASRGRAIKRVREVCRCAIICPAPSANVLLRRSRRASRQGTAFRK